MNEYRPAVQHLHLALVPVNIVIRSADRHLRLVLAFQGTRVAPGRSFARHAERHRHFEDVFAGGKKGKKKKCRQAVGCSASTIFLSRLKIPRRGICMQEIELVSPVGCHFQEEIQICIARNTLGRVTASRFSNKAHAVFHKKNRE